MIISNQPTDLLLQNADKNAYEKIAILCKYANGYGATSLTLHSSVCVFFFLLGFLSQTFTIPKAAGKGEGYLFNFSLLLSTSLRDSKREPLVSEHMCVFPFICNSDSSKFVTLKKKNLVSS